MNQRGTHRDQGVRGFHIPFLYHDHIEMGKHFVDEPFSTGTGQGIFQGWKRGSFIKYAGTAVCTRTE
jgi:hypothetical protein